MENLLEQYYSLPVTSNPKDFLAGKGHWGLTAEEHKLAMELAKQICSAGQ
jgi:hypothetical protein